MSDIENDKEIITRAYIILHMLSKKKSPEYSGNMCHLLHILERYAEPWRFYHTATHIADGFEKIISISKYIKDPLVVYWAWLYHDIVYVPLVPTNELRSAILASDELERLGLPTETMRAIHESICATENHLIPDNYSGNKDDLGILLDVDLSSLGDPHDLFVKVGEKLRREVSNLTDKEFNAGRAAFCGKMLGRDSIFKTKHFKHLEQQARDNLMWAIEQSI